MLERGLANIETVAFITGTKSEGRESKILKLYAVENMNISLAHAKHIEYRIITDPDVSEC